MKQAKPEKGIEIHLNLAEERCKSSGYLQFTEINKIKKVQ
jgi:hypothetical protein